MCLDSPSPRLGDLFIPSSHFQGRLTTYDKLGLLLCPLSILKMYFYNIPGSVVVEMSDVNAIIYIGDYQF